MNTLKKLQQALELMKEAEDLVNECRAENETLQSYYGYSLEIIAQELNQFSDNSRMYMGRNTNLEEIIETEGENWNSDGSIEDEEIEEDEEEITPVKQRVFVMPELPDGFNIDELKDAAIEIMKESKLQAVKFVKDKTTWGLLESKQFCDELQNTQA